MHDGSKALAMDSGFINVVSAGGTIVLYATPREIRPATTLYITSLCSIPQIFGVMELMDDDTQKLEERTAMLTFMITASLRLTTLLASSRSKPK